MTVLSKNLAVVAMSGGVDSSVAALLLREQGLEVIGISMKTHDERDDRIDSVGARGGIGGEVGVAAPRSKTCCTAADINDARRVCQHLDIPFYPLNFKDEFEEKVIHNFGREYSEGRTPNPCVQCNQHMKFSALLHQARQLGAYYLATGHYAQKSRDRTGKYHLLRAKDRDKDQTYFLFGLGQEQLEHTLFPIGKYSKDEVREFARSAGLKTADKPESQEICFVSQNDYADFIEKSLPQFRGEPGPFVDEEGNVLGKHQGIHAYTVGQRRGLGVSGEDRYYVTGIVPAENKIVLGSKASLLKNGLIAKGVKWVHRESVSSGISVEVKLRHRHPGVSSTLSILDETTVQIDFNQPEGAVTPGQAAVFYEGDEVLGGGFIEKGI